MQFCINGHINGLYHICQTLVTTLTLRKIKTLTVVNYHESTLTLGSLALAQKCQHVATHFKTLC